MKVISRNQVHADLWPVCACFKNYFDEIYYMQLLYFCMCFEDEKILHAKIINVKNKFAAFEALSAFIWGYIVYVFNFFNNSHLKYCFCSQVIGDTGQGFVNFVFFCVLQAKVRQYVKDVIRRCWDCCNHDDVIDDESFTASVTPSQMSSCSSDPQRDRIEDWHNVCNFLRIIICDCVLENRLSTHKKWNPFFACAW